MTNSQTQALQKAVQLLQQGDVVAFPTETVYGLGACITSEMGLRKIFSTKQRPFFDPLIVHVASLEQAKTCFSDWSLMAQFLAENFWPGPLTLVMPKAEIISELITSGLPNVGVRWPKHTLAQELLRQVQVPLAAPSANKFGKTSPTQAQHVRKEFGDDVFVLDEGASEIGIESTVLLVKEVLPNHFQLSILRKGAVVKTELEQALQKSGLHYAWVETVEKKEAPGHMKHHYMPEIPFVVCRNPQLKLSELGQILNDKLKDLPDEVEGVKIVKPTKKIEKIEFLRLSTDAQQAARELYAQLRLASERKPEALCYIQMPQNNSEHWEALYDRLHKAASLIID